MILRFALVMLALANAASAVAVVETRQAWRQSSIELARLVRERDALNVEYRRLQLEQATWTQSRRIDQIARARLGMQVPGASNTVLVWP